MNNYKKIAATIILITLLFIVTYEKTGKNKDAVQAYKKAIKSKTNFADAQFNLGAIYAELGMYKEALEVGDA